MGTYINRNRVVRNGILVAFAGEAMTEAEAKSRGLLSDEDRAAATVKTTVKGLKAYAVENDIDLSGASSKDDIAATIEKAETEKAEKEAALEAERVEAKEAVIATAVPGGKRAGRK